MRPSGDSDGSQFADFLKGEPGYKAKFTFTGNSQGIDWSSYDFGAYDDEGKKVQKEANIKEAKRIKGFKVLTEGLKY